MRDAVPGDAVSQRGVRMRRLAHIALLACLSALANAAIAFDNGQYENVPPDIRAWFKSVIAAERRALLRHLRRPSNRI